jgi:hypothetical protein
LEGPFAVIVRGDDRNQIAAYAPYDKEKIHQFYYPDFNTPQMKPRYSFVLSEQGLQTPNHPPYMDHGFDDFNVHLANWKPSPKDYYVAIDLPAPDVVTYIPPLEGVLFEPERQDSSPRFGRLPGSHVLEYRVEDASKIILSSRQLGELHPMPCRDVPAQYGGGQEEGRGGDSNQKRPNIDRELESCSQSVVYFLGIGLRPGLDPGLDSNYLDEHAIEFFNGRLLPSMFGKEIPRGLKLLKVGVEPSQGLQYPRSPLTPAVLRYPLLTLPRIMEVGLPLPAGSNCVGNLSATGHTTISPFDDKIEACDLECGMGRRTRHSK